MISTKEDMKTEVREMTDYTSTSVLSEDGLDSAYRTAQRHIQGAKSLGLEYDWYAEENSSAREALFWFTCVFCKRQTGELDAQDIQIGAINFDNLNSKETGWVRDANKALRNVNASSIIRVTSPSRTDREYTADSATREGGTGSGTGSGTGTGTDPSI